MAIPKRAVVRAVRSLGAATRAIDLDLLGDEPLGRRGGQYIIVDSGLVLPNGKAVKRAYSPINDDREQNRVELWVMRIDGGPGSGFLHAVAPGREIAYSGPWGKLYPALVSGDSGAIPQRTLIVATDTGITAALGLVRSWRMARSLGDTALVWLRARPDYFIDEREIAARLPAGIGRVHIGLLPPIGHAERLAIARGVVADLGGAAAFTQGFISGDGVVNYGLLDDLVAAGIPATRENVESFFNMLKRAAPAVADAVGTAGTTG
jgi:ferredoxin-NADP reductase